MSAIVTIGEILIDLTFNGRKDGIPVYTANPGGAPANVAVAAARLGADAAFIGKVGKDYYGSFLRGTLADNGVDVSGLLTDPEAPTTLAIVSVDESGERSFSFYRRTSADVLLRPDEVSTDMLSSARFLHFGSVSLTDEPAREATLYAAKKARELGATVTYDPNYRSALWQSEELAVDRMKEALYLCDILKISDEELPLLTGTDDPEAGTRMLFEQYGVKLILLTLGPDGAYYRRGELTGKVDGVKVTVADTNGAGDTFFGAFLSRLAAQGISRPDELTEDQLRENVRFANHAAALTTSRHGAIPAMPTLEEVNAKLGG
jgi:fructokinase